MTPGMKKPLVRRLLIPVVEIRISSGAMLVPTKGLDRLVFIIFNTVNSINLKKFVNVTNLKTVTTVFGTHDVSFKIRCHRLALCRYPLMREKCFVVECSGFEPKFSWVISPCRPSHTPLQNIPVIAGVFIRARRALSRYSPTARNRLLFNLPNSRKDIFMQTMRTVCPDCGS